MTARPRGHGHAQRSPDQALAELREQVDAQIQTLTTGEDWARWLRIAACFPSWSFTNVMLIAAQRPDATDLAGYEEWRTCGRQVRRGEPRIGVIAEPGRPPAGARLSDGYNRPAGRGRRQSGHADGGAPGTSAGAARVASVWDISQTSGPLLRGPAAPLPDQGTGSAGLWEALTWLARREGFAVERATSNEGDSETIWAARRIRVSAQLDGPAAVHALLHELVHILAHGRAADVPRERTAGCRGLRRVEADSAAFIVAARLGLDTSLYEWPFVASWAGSDPRARPGEAVRAAGDRIMSAAAVIVTHLDVTLFGKASGDAPAVRAEGPEPGQGGVLGRDREEAPEEEIRRALAEAERFYCERLRGSWAAGYLTGRGLGPAAARRWRAGYAPAGWIALVSHLHRLGHSDLVIEAAGLARLSARGTLIDCFRDRAVFAVRDERGQIAGFVGRARPGAGEQVPKYINSPQTVVYRKGSLLFGMWEGRGLLECGAVPVIVEGPFDAIAVTEAGQGRYVGLAPCGTALTGRQLAALASMADLDRAGVLVALDGDRAGREGLVRAYEALLAHTSRLSAVILPTGRDPAEILQKDGAAALAQALARTDPLAQVVIDAYLDGWGSRLDHAEGQLAAMRSAARFIASTLPDATVDAIHPIAAGRGPDRPDKKPRPTLGGAGLAGIARMLPTGVVCQIVRVAERTRSECSEVTAEVVAAVGIACREGGVPLSRAGNKPLWLAPNSAPGSALKKALPAPSRRRNGRSGRR